VKYKVPDNLDLISKCSTEDGRLTKDAHYDGILIWVPRKASITGHSGLRYIVFDNKKEWMTFDPKVFVVNATSKLTLDQKKAKAFIEGDKPAPDGKDGE
jgi:hypothetical protein